MQILLRSKPLSYEVNVRDQIYSRHAFQLLKNQTGHQNLSENQQEQLLDINSPSKHSESQDVLKPGAKI